MERFRKFLASPSGKLFTGSLLLVALASLVYSFVMSFGDSEDIAASKSRHFVCSETGKAFAHSIKPGESWPLESPYSGKKTGYPGEPCYWSKDGKIKSSPTWVLVKHYLGQKGPTFCPDCGRLVVPQNPPPVEGSPPPTEGEYKSNPKPGR